MGKTPLPFDPYYGALEIFEVGGGIYLINDVPLFKVLPLEGGGLMSLLSGPTPPGVAGTNSGTTNFTVGYQYGTNGSLVLGVSVVSNCLIALAIQTPATNVTDVFGATNLLELALPSLSRTNWAWLTRANGRATNFSWGQTNWCERYFQLSIMQDSDNDGLTDAYERLVSHTAINTANSPRAFYEGVISNQNPSAWFKLNDTSLINAISGPVTTLTNGGGAWGVDAFATGNSAFSFTNTSNTDRLTADDVIQRRDWHQPRFDEPAVSLVRRPAVGQALSLQPKGRQRQPGVRGVCRNQWRAGRSGGPESADRRPNGDHVHRTGFPSVALLGLDLE